MSDFAGQWFTTFGPMTLNQQGQRVTGTYNFQGTDNSLEGEVHDGTLVFRYQEPATGGEGQFWLVRHGMFQGQWRRDGDPTWRPWQGNRQFDGIWETSFGLMRLIQETDRVFGFYEGAGSATMEGKLQDNRLSFRYQEPRTAGEGWFDLSPDCFTFDGQWRQDDHTTWGPWTAQRLLPRPGVRWLVVLEANWQSYLREREYSFGAMLKEIFARVPGVEMRHRFFTHEDGLAMLCRDMLYLPEPAVLMLATHGTAEGLATRGGTIGPRVLIDNLRQADNLMLLHFSSCLVMDGGPAGNFMRSLQGQLRFPISGYASSVEWGSSALIEFTYLDLILAKGLNPAEAAEQLKNLLPFAGDEPIPGSPYAPACFRFWQPQDDALPSLR